MSLKACLLAGSSEVKSGMRGGAGGAFSCLQQAPEAVLGGSSQAQGHAQMLG